MKNAEVDDVCDNNHFKYDHEQGDKNDANGYHYHEDHHECDDDDELSQQGYCS